MCVGWDSSEGCQGKVVFPAKDFSAGFRVDPFNHSHNISIYLWRINILLGHHSEWMSTELMNNL